MLVFSNFQISIFTTICWRERGLKKKTEERKKERKEGGFMDA